MSEFEHKAALPFRETELVGEDGRKTRLIDANTAEAEAMGYEDFWRSVIGEDPTALGSEMSMNLQAYFGKEHSPDEIIVVLPSRGTWSPNAVREMVSTCWKSYFAMKGSLGGLWLPSLNREDPEHDTLISVEEGDWYSAVPNHDGRGDSYSVFRAAKAKLPKGFLEISPQRLTDEQWGVVREGLVPKAEQDR